jgi:hypothetical protein
MPYYVRVMSTAADCVPFRNLLAALDATKHHARLTLDGGTEGDWSRILLEHADGTYIALIERNPVQPGSLAEEELQEFSAEIEDCRPASGRDWLRQFLPRVRCIYACQLLGGTDHKNGWQIFGRMKDAIWSFAPAINQADGEGFSNEDGYHILWQFSATQSIVRRSWPARFPWASGRTEIRRWALLTNGAACARAPTTSGSIELGGAIGFAPARP